MEHWFFANYGSTGNLLDKQYQIKSTWLWDRIRERPENSDLGVTNLKSEVDHLKEINRNWDPLIKEIRDPTHIPDIPGEICEELKDLPAG